MARKIIPDSGAAAPAGKPQLHPDTAKLVVASRELVIAMCTFVELAQREIDEAASTDFNNMEFLVKGAHAEISRFDKVLFETFGEEVQS